MRSSFAKQNNTKIILWAIILAVICAAGFIVVQEIEVPTEHISQPISVNSEK
ncbi:MAG: hypothetical protein J6039_03295 [Alphaproteobacteria bacterium]|nr:hypothetical protein [Alphaproteobacteria bacterium]